MYLWTKPLPMCKNPEEKDEPLFLYDMYLKSNGKISFISL